MNRLWDCLGFELRMGFKVKDNMWSYKMVIDELQVRDKGMSYIYPAVDKLLASKETARICVKFWTGVEIV